MKKVTILLLLVLLLSFIPEYNAHSAPENLTSGFYWYADYDVWYTFNRTGTGTQSLATHLDHACNGNPIAGAVVHSTGQWVSLGGNGYSDGWLVKANSTYTTLATVKAAFASYYGWSPTYTKEITEPITDLTLRYSTDLHEIFFYCYGSGSQYPLEIERFSFKTNPNVTSCASGTCTRVTPSNFCGTNQKIIGQAVNASGTGTLSFGASTFRAGLNGWHIFQPGGNGFEKRFNDLFTAAIGAPNYVWAYQGILGSNTWNGLYPDYVGLTAPKTIASAYAYCFDANTDYINPPGAIGNVLKDGDMEQQPISNAWFPDTSTGGSFGRISNTNLLQVGYGDPACGNGWQIIGNTNLCGWSLVEYYNLLCAAKFAPVRQRFNWYGGKMYWRFSARGMPDGGWDRQVNIQVWVTNTATSAQTMFFSGGVPSNWVTKTGYTASLPAGEYVINMYKGIGNAEADAFAIDDMVIDTAPINPTACSTQAVLTPTPTITPTTAGVPGPNVLLNCGFEQGPTYWNWQQGKSEVIYTGTNNYSYAAYDSPNPGVSQNITWGGGLAYVKFKSDTDYNVYFRSLSTGAVYSVASGSNNVTGWITRQATVNLPAGSYQLSLHHLIGSTHSQYDDLSINAGNYGSCTSGSNATPTAQPSATTAAGTATMWPTSTPRATSTVLAGTATSTAVPSFTPFPTFTPGTTQLPTNTPRPLASSTPWPTYTPAATKTPLPPPATNTPNAEGTIVPVSTYTATSEPPPPQPPPDYYSDCERPTNPADLAGWLEYNRCVALSFLSMSPRAIATINAYPETAKDREPWGTIDEVKDTQEELKTLIDSYDWTGSAPGIDEQPQLTDLLYPDETSPLNGGQWDFTPDTTASPNMTCAMRMGEAIGPGLAQGVCWVWNILGEKGITAWLQFFINLTAIAVLLIYITKKFIDAGTTGA